MSCCGVCSGLLGSGDVGIDRGLVVVDYLLGCSCIGCSCIGSAGGVSGLVGSCVGSLLGLLGGGVGLFSRLSRIGGSAVSNDGFGLGVGCSLRC